MNPIVVRVAYRHMKAFQFALAQAFADQVGMPDRMNLAQLTKLLSRAFLGLVAELEWASEGLKLDGMTSVNLPYGSFQDPGWENGPPEQDEGSFDIPMGAVGRYTAWTTTKNLARALSNMWVPTQFFRHKLKEIAVFLSSSENRVLVEKFLSGIPLNNVVSDTPFAEFDSDALADLFSKNASSEITGTPGASASVGDVRWDFDGMTLMFAVTVNFSYDNIDELEVEPSEREPDYDDRWD